MALPSNFYIPRSRDLPAFRCRLCGEVVHGEVSFGRHVKNCSDAREEEILTKHSPSGRNPWLWGNEADPEWREWAQRTGDWH